jgi:hypothetical protein
MRTIIILALTFFMAACNEKPTNSHVADETTKRAYQIENPEKWYPVHTYEYDGCQYIVFGFGDRAVGAHKGNCTNSIHENNR